MTDKEWMDNIYAKSDDINVYDAIKVLIQDKHDKHAVAVIKMMERLSYYDGRLQAHYDLNRSGAKDE